MKKLNRNQKKFLGSVPKKYQLVETFWDCPEISKTSNKGITLIALIITIIVMLILVGVTINVALNGGLFGKAKKATYQTEASMIKEQLEIANAIKIDNNGKIPADYGITIEKLDISDDLKSKYGTKLVISSDGILYYLEAATNAEEQSWLEEIGIDKYVEPEPPTGDSYTFTLGDIVPKGSWSDMGLSVPLTSFWSDTTSDELKNSGMSHPIYPDMMKTYNVTCSDATIPNKSSEDPNSSFDRGYALWNMGENMVLNIKLTTADVSELEYINKTNWEQYKDLEFTITK